MTTWYQTYVDIWDALVTLVEGLKDVDGNKLFIGVYYGEKYSPDNYPICYVCPMPIPMEQLTFRTTMNHGIFEFGVLVQNSNPKLGYLKAFELVGKISDALTADRTLGGKACGLECQQAIPNWRGMGSGMEDHCVGLRADIKFIGT